MKEKLLAEFSKIFGGDGQAELFFSPGRCEFDAASIRTITEDMYFRAH